MLIGRCTVAQLAEIQSFSVHLSMCFTVRKERAQIPQRNTLENLCHVTVLLMAVRKKRPLGAPLAQCACTIWASSRTGDPYFVILGASLLPVA